MVYIGNQGRKYLEIMKRKKFNHSNKGKMSNCNLAGNPSLRR